MANFDIIAAGRDKRAAIRQNAQFKTVGSQGKAGDRGVAFVLLPAVASNTVTSPNVSLTGNLTIKFDMALDNYAPAGNVTIASKTTGNNGWSVLLLTTGVLRFIVGDGVGLTNSDCTAALPATCTNASRHTFTVIWQDGVGTTFQLDGTNLAAQTATVKTLANAAVVLTLGSTTSTGKVVDMTITNSSSTTYYHLNPDKSGNTTANGATWTSDNGEVYTLNTSGTTPAAIVRGTI